MKQQFYSKAWFKQLVMVSALCTSHYCLYAQPVQLDKKPTEVLAIYPTAQEVPENLLRFYVRFSRSMQRGDAYDHIYLLDSVGQRVAAPFLRIGQELWDADMQVLTLMLDPGRIKQGVAPHVVAGSPLKQAHTYTLVIAPGLLDVQGDTLSSYRKSFTATQPDHASPDPNQWRLSSPAQGSRQPLVVRLDGTIDPIIAQRTIRVEDPSGKRLTGTMKLSAHERTLSFVPAQEWTLAAYRLAVHSSLEDYAGNRVDVLFDMQAGTVTGVLSQHADASTTYRTFDTTNSIRYD